MKFFYSIVSYIFHPLFILSYVFVFMLFCSPYQFHFSDPKDKVLVLVSVLSLSLIFPLISILMMKGLGLVQSFEMDDKKERIGPLISTGLFYMWLFINIRNHPFFPESFRVFVLGSVISLFIAFFINNFSKVSLHTTGAGGGFAMIAMIAFIFGPNTVYISVGNLIQLEMSIVFLFIFSLLVAGLVGTARLGLKAHVKQEVYGGYMIGIFGQLIAFKLLMN